MKIIHVTYWNGEPWEDSDNLTFGFFSTMEKAKAAVQKHAPSYGVIVEQFKRKTTTWCFAAREAQLKGQVFNEPEPKIEDCVYFDEYEVDAIS